MANNKDFKVKNGIKAEAYIESLGTVTTGTIGNPKSLFTETGTSYTYGNEGNARGLYLKPDGTKFYIVGTGDDTVYQYSMSTANDISTASYDSVSFNVNGQETSPQGIAFSLDGEKMYVIGDVGDGVDQYILSTAWDVSTATYDGFVSISSLTATPSDIAFSSDGTKMFVMGETDTIHWFELYTPWDVTDGLLYVSEYDLSTTFNVSNTTIEAFDFSADGHTMIVPASDSFYKLNLERPYDLRTASLYDEYDYVLDYSVDSLRMSSDSTTILYLSMYTDKLHELKTEATLKTLDTGTGSVFDTTMSGDTVIKLSNPPASGLTRGATLILEGPSEKIPVRTFDLGAVRTVGSSSASVSSYDSIPMDIVYSSDGKHAYMLGSQGNDINHYDFTSASSTYLPPSNGYYSDRYYLLNYASGTPRGMFIHPEGTRVYTVHDSDNVYQADLTTAWDISTVSSSSAESFSVSSQETVPWGLEFSRDGTKMYVCGTAGDDVNQYSLSTAWDVTTASFVKRKALGLGNLYSVRFSSDGSRMIVLRQANDSVYEYVLSTPWDVNTASSSGVDPFNYFDGTLGESNPTGMSWAYDGSYLFIIGTINDNVYRFSAGGDPAAKDPVLSFDNNIKFSDGATPPAPSLNKKNIYTFTTSDGGASYLGTLVGKDFS